MFLVDALSTLLFAVFVLVWMVVRLVLGIVRVVLALGVISFLIYAAVFFVQWTGHHNSLYAQRASEALAAAVICFIVMAAIGVVRDYVPSRHQTRDVSFFDA